jgi:MFS family permease
MAKHPSAPDGDTPAATMKSSRTAVRAQVLAAERESIVTARNLVLTWLVVAAVLVVRRYLADGARLAMKSGDRALWRNQIAEVQQRLVMYASIATLLLVAGGLGHLVIPLARVAAGSAVAVAGGWMALLGSVLSAGYAAFKMSPSAGADSHTTNGSRSTRILFAIAPPLLLIVLLIALAGGGRSAITAVLADGAMFDAVVFINLIGVLLAWVYATCEASWIQVFRRVRVMAVLVGMCGAAAGTMAALVWPLVGTDIRRWVLLIFATFCFWMMAARVSALISTDDERTTLRKNGSSIPARPLASVLFSVIFVVSTAMTLRVAGASRDVSQVMAPLMSLALVFSLVLGGITYSRLGEGQRRKALSLLAFSVIVSACWTLTALRGWPPPSPAMAGIALLAALSTWVLAVGWSTDPNALSLHMFYRARLVRGYLSASNPKRVDRRPQQSTADQFFDEPQFESYRRLGFHCGEAAFDVLMPAADPKPGNPASPVPGHPLGAVFARFTDAVGRAAGEAVEPAQHT